MSATLIGRVVLVGILLLFSAFWTVSALTDFVLWEPDPRPANVPVDAVAVPNIAKSTLWARCWNEGSVTRCQIFNPVGLPLHIDRFLTYDTGEPVSAAELSIVPERSGRDYVYLRNGKVLLPATRYEAHRQNYEQFVIGSVPLGTHNESVEAR